MKLVSIVISGALACSWVACAADDGAGHLDTGTVARGVVRANDTELNGIRVNGIRVNGIRVNGIRVNGIRVNGIRVNGIRVNGTMLEGVTVDGTRLEGADFIGAELTAVTDAGDTFPVRIDDAERRLPPDDDVWNYSVSYTTDQGLRASLCAAASGAPVTATILLGRWNEEQGVPGGGAHIDDPELFTFACEGYVLAKCVDAGYKPWVSQVFADHHQACTRVLRADYCGDGTPHTIDGTLVNVYDDLGVELDTENWPKEAEWDADGARCLVRPRVEKRPNISCARQLRGCGAKSRFEPGALLVSESDPHDRH